MLFDVWLLRGRLMAGHHPLEVGMKVRILPPQHYELRAF